MGIRQKNTELYFPVATHYWQAGMHTYIHSIYRIWWYTPICLNSDYVHVRYRECHTFLLKGQVSVFIAWFRSDQITYPKPGRVSRICTFWNGIQIGKRQETYLSIILRKKRQIKYIADISVLLTRAVESLLHVTSTSIVGCKSKPYTALRWPW